MLVKIKMAGSKEYMSRKIDQLRREDQAWITLKFKVTLDGEPIKMDLDEVTGS
jgi:hypothetical protein